MYRVTLTYPNGSDLIDVKPDGKVNSNASAIVEALKRANLKMRRTGCYHTVEKIEVQWMQTKEYEVSA